jgi:hypothetical protein
MVGKNDENKTTLKTYKESRLKGGKPGSEPDDTGRNPAARGYFHTPFAHVTL